MARAKTQSKVGAERARLFKLSYANPISGLTPARLISWINAFQRGDLRQAVLLWQQILERDDMVGPCFDKRARAVTSLSWEILPIDDSAEAAKHAEALKHFYNNLTAYDGLNEMERGGTRQLFKQMLSAIGMKYAMHEIIWKPGAPGGLTADFKFLPLQFFENTTGRLRYLPTDYQPTGVDLDAQFTPGGWMCNTGRGLLLASSIAYLFKVPAGLKAWVSFMEKFSLPPLHGKTSAQPGSTEWLEVKAALEGYGEDLALLTDESTSITPLELKAGGQAPHAPLVERMDRAISRLWMGGDLATMSKDSGAVGSQPQSDDLDKIQEDDAAMITDALQHYVDREVIRQRFGDVDPLAYFRLAPPARTNIDRERLTDEFLVKLGVPVGQKQLMERYGRSEPESADVLAALPVAAAPAFNPFTRAANERPPTDVFKSAALKDLSEAQAATLRPLVDRLNAILALPDDKIEAAIEALQRDLPRINREVLRDATLQVAFENILGTALVQGAATAAETQRQP